MDVVDELLTNKEEVFCKIQEEAFKSSNSDETTR